MSEGRPSSAEDPFQLARFVTAQQQAFEVARAELQTGRKTGHWMWYIFPQLQGLGHSSMAKHYAIGSLAEARAYMAHPTLREHLLDCCRAILSIEGKSAYDILGYPDDMKLKSSMTLFALASPTHVEFAAVLKKYFEGRQDPRTLALLSEQPLQR